MFNYRLKLIWERAYGFFHSPMIKTYLPIISGVLYLVMIFTIVFVYLQTAPPEQFPKESLITIPSGITIKDAGSILKANNIIKNETLFELWMNIRYDNIKAGDYLFKSKESMWSVARRLAVGAHGLTPVKITIKEGATRKEMADVFAGKLLRFNKDKFLLMTINKEGYLFPDTYYFLPNANERQIIDAMYNNFLKKIEPFKEDIDKNSMSLHDIVTLASLVEREAHKYDDRRKIAGVLLNRLAIDMPLQVDVTWFYTDNKGTPGITIADLKDKNNPYNTYIHKGLPPSPIGSPSLSAIKAVLYPEKNDFLFYLADSKGNTYFSKTYKEHLYKRRKYIR